MEKTLITINEAATLINKSPQTIRRLIRHKQIKFRRKHTPQGFNYFIEKKDLLVFFDLADESDNAHATDEFLPDDDVPDKEPISRAATAPHRKQAVAPETPHPVYHIQASQQQESTVIASSTIEHGLHSLPEEPVVTQDEKTLPIKNDDSVFAETIAYDDSVKTRADSQKQSFIDFNNTLSKLIAQYERVISQQDEDKRNLFKLVGTFQERVVTLEQRLKQLEAPKKRKWYHFFF